MRVSHIAILALLAVSIYAVPAKRNKLDRKNHKNIDKNDYFESADDLGAVLDTSTLDSIASQLIQDEKLKAVINKQKLYEWGQYLKITESGLFKKVAYQGLKNRSIELLNNINEELKQGQPSFQLSYEQVEKYNQLLQQCSDGAFLIFISRPVDEDTEERANSDQSAFYTQRDYLFASCSTPELIQISYVSQYKIARFNDINSKNNQDLYFRAKQFVKELMKYEFLSQYTKCPAL